MYQHIFKFNEKKKSMVKYFFFLVKRKMVRFKNENNAEPWKS